MFNKVIFPVDLADLEQIDAALKEAENLVHHIGAELRIVTVIPKYNMPIMSSYIPQQAVDNVKEQTKQALLEFIKQRADKDIAISYAIREGRPHEGIIAEAESWGADLIAMPSHIRTGLSAVFIGSVAQRVTERAKCSVLVLRGRH